MSEQEQQPASFNKLEHETSPYLQQHASNPVNWYPWGDYALELAKKQGKPILLSIGYSTCHWCHVMMHESFCDPDIAATMNRLFVNIKVDKEERPDIDKIYQIAYQLLMAQPGGWPLTMFLSPETLLPYYGGTYLPKKAKEEGEIDFAVLLHKLNDVYYHEKEKIKFQENQTKMILGLIFQPQVASEVPLVSEIFQRANTALQKEFDERYGGLGQEAKFPNCPELQYLLEIKDILTKQILYTTLDHMAYGGIFDHLAGGFFRYTIDPEWQIPHFEKMLYDNAQLLGIYAQAYQTTHNVLYKSIAEETADWMINTLLDPKTNCFYTAIDADSDGNEGASYVWDLEEIKKALHPNEFTVIQKYFKLDQKANFEHQWHLSINSKITAPDITELRQIKQKLLQIRNQRSSPHVDKKILTAANSLAIIGFSLAGQIFRLNKYLKVAANIINFIRTDLYIDKQLYATWQQDQPKIKAFLDDYAYLLYGTLIYIENDPLHELMPFCRELADSLIANFYDPTHGGFFFNSNQAEQLLFRPKTFTDEVTPAGNGIACLALLKLGKLLRNPDYTNAARKTIQAAQAFINDAPEVHLTMCLAYAALHNEEQKN